MSHTATSLRQIVRNVLTAASAALLLQACGGGGDGGIAGPDNGATRVWLSADNGVTGYELFVSDGTAGGTSLVKDINTIRSSRPGPTVEVNGVAYFVVPDGNTGLELWKSDGTAPGTVVVRGFDQRADDGNAITSLIGVGSTLYFVVYDETYGRELWKSDGTTAGTVMVSDINPGTGSSDPRSLTAMGGILYFTATDQTLGSELWKTDGTAAGTVLVRDINPGSRHGHPRALTAIGNTLYFVATTNTDGDELWKTDGTVGGTVMVLDIAAGVGSAFPAYYRDSHLVAAGSALYFRANNGVAGYELWRSDGTATGTVMVMDIYPGFPSGLGYDFYYGPHLTAVGNTVYFIADNGVNGEELWRSEGTAATTVLVQDIFPGASSAFPYYRDVQLVSAGSTLYFVYHRHLLKSDAVSTGVVSSFPSEPYNLTAMGGMVYFGVETAANGRELWRSNGTAAGTVMVKDIYPGPTDGGPANLSAGVSTLYFSANDGTHGIEPWRSDGTETGTFMVADIGTVRSDSSDPSSVVTIGGTSYFIASDGSNIGGHGSELWKSDGTEAGTVLVKDISLGIGSSYPSNLTAVGGVLYFTADDSGEESGIYGRELWKTDGTEAGTVVVKDIYPGPGGSSIRNLVAVGSTLYFTAYNATYGTELWKSDGTEAGTVLVKDIRQSADGSYPYYLTAVGSTLYFSADDGISGNELWKSDGTEAGTVLVKDIDAAIAGEGNPRSFVAVGTTLYFTAYDPTHGRELWKSDGTEAGTVLVRDVTSGMDDTRFYSLIAVDDTLYFTAHDGIAYALWKSDGSAAGTVVVKDMDNDVDNLTAMGGALYFTTYDERFGSELWKSDGTERGTVMVKDSNLGTGSSDPENLIAIGNTLYFTAESEDADGEYLGTELWKSDGTEAGTVNVVDLYPGNRSGVNAILNPRPLVWEDDWWGD